MGKRKKFNKSVRQQREQDRNIDLWGQCRACGWPTPNHASNCSRDRYVDDKGRTPAERKALVWCSKHQRPVAQCKSARCHKRHPGL